MKELDKNKAYDLSNLNAYEIYKIAEYVFKNKHKRQTFNSIGETIKFLNNNKSRSLNYSKSIDCGETCNVWGFSETNNEVVDAKELFTEWTPKQGEKVLVSDGGVEWKESFFVTKYNDYYYTDLNGKNSYLFGWKHIKPFEEQIKVGDWVKTNDKEIFKVSLKHNLDYLNGKQEKFFKVTDENLIKLLESEL